MVQFTLTVMSQVRPDELWPQLCLHALGFETMIANYATDIPILKGDHKRYLYGAGSIMVAHSDHEHLKISDLETAVEGYKKLIAHALK